MEQVRVDKWVWAARFFKTRSEAQRQVSLGRVKVAGARVKPSRVIRVGDNLEINTEHGDFEVVVMGLSDRRGPAAQARLLYEETPESIERRARMKEHAKQPMMRFEGKGRPSKRDRRKLGKMKNWENN